MFALAACAATGLAAAPRAGAEALLLVDVESGKVLHTENGNHPWYPASITKIMTAYVTLRAVKEGRITLDKLLVVSHNAVAQQPVKMGFPAGTTVTVDNALKMLMVKSANDIAVVLAEGVGGSIEGFAELMNQHARRLGMVQSHWVNPNGLPADEQITSARDMAILTRAVIREFPEYDYYWHLPGIRLGNKVQRNYNTLIGRYPGADGMKTGFICASGFNLVATASRDGKRMIAIVLGAPSSSVRAIKAAQLLERGFTSNPLSWLAPSMGSVDAMQPINATPPNLREEMCGGHRKRQAAEDEDDSAAVASLSGSSAYAVFMSSLRAPTGKNGNLLQDGRLGEPVVVFTGAQLRMATEPKAKKGVQTAAKPPSVKPATASAGTAPWTSLSPSGIANSPPPELAAPTDPAKPAASAKSKAKTEAQKKAAPKSALTQAQKTSAQKTSQVQKTTPKANQATAKKKDSEKQ
ncbi:MAG: D-alanyl-D-alanine carboxypeptidase [Alphaproteobacteria bacterium]|nr:D-alanyl-D-alanine carboxypeptidase [Alphaproteobacteria bacterium]